MIMQVVIPHGTVPCRPSLFPESHVKYYQFLTEKNKAPSLKLSEEYDCLFAHDRLTQTTDFEFNFRKKEKTRLYVRNTASHTRPCSAVQ
jgi:hypothetical protein